jgi:ABC-type transport system involved in cytochrome c biogenesis permease component
MAELRAVLAVARKDLRNFFRYPINAAGWVLTPLYQFLIPAFLFGATFLVGGRAVGLEASAGTSDIGGFLFIGTVIGGLISAAFWSVAWSVRFEMDAGTLEPSWLTPTRLDSFILGRALAGLVIYGVTAAILLPVGLAFFGATFLPTTAYAIPALLLAGLSMLGVAYAITAIVLLLKEANFFVDTTNFLFSGFSGVPFPITALPWALQLVAFALPTMYALDILRQQALGTRPLLDPFVEHAALASLAVLALWLGRRSLARAEHRLRVQGTIAQH